MQRSQRFLTAMSSQCHPCFICHRTKSEFGQIVWANPTPRIVILLKVTQVMANFGEAIIQGCKVLLNEHAFTVYSQNESLVEIKSERVVISFSYDRRRAHELNVYVELRSTEGTSAMQYTLGEVMREFNVPRAKERSYLQSSSLETISEFVSDACKVLIQNCKPILDGCVAAFESVKSRSSVESKQYTLEMGLRGMRKEVDEAWSTKDYAKYRSLLKGYESVLSEVEKKKLEFAHRS